MDDFENNRNEELGAGAGDPETGSEAEYVAPENAASDTSAPWADSGITEPAAPTEKTDDLNGASSGGAYPYHADGTYGYARSAQNGEETARPQQSGYQYQPPRYTGQYGAAQPGGTQQNGPYNPAGPNNAYPYQNSNPYPYQSRPRGYAYPDGDGGDGGKKKGSGGKIFGIITGSLCVLLIAALVFVIVSGRKETPSSEKPDTSVSEEEATKKEDVDELVTQESPDAVGHTENKGEMTPKEIYSKVLESSVGILVYNKSDSLASEGTGVLFQEDKEGKYTYIVTCAHVITGNNGTVMVQLHNEEQYKAEIVGFDTRTDIGVLKIEERGLTLAEIGDSSKLAVGDSIYAIGNPGGVEFANSFTGGMVSALDRPVNSSSSGYTMECIQHTAAINPGNSGGALVNVFGQVIGINSMKIVDDEYEGMGFSVPSSVFVDIVNNIITNGYVANRPKLGITYVAAQNYNSYGMFVAIKELPKGSIVIYSIAKDSSLAGTEAKEGDMIIAVNGKDLDDSAYLPELIEKSNVGDEITLTLLRINRDYSYEQFEVEAKLVEDRGDTAEEQPAEEETDPEDYFRGYFDDYFKDYFGDFFR